MERINSQAMREKVKDCRLRATDILLIHTKRSLWGWLIRSGTHCYWNHALMVCSSEGSEQDCGDMLAVDAKTDGTIVMSHVSEYLSRADKYDVAVKRLEVNWFHNENETFTDVFRSSICDMAINEVDFTFHRRLTRYFKQIIRQLTVIYRFIRRRIHRAHTQVNLSWNIRPRHFKAFTCGGFVQWCYYKAVSKMLKENNGDYALLKDVVFNPRIKQEPTPYELLTTTPADLANCDKLSWKYIIKNGRMKEIPNSHDRELIAVPA